MWRKWPKSCTCASKTSESWNRFTFDSAEVNAQHTCEEYKRNHFALWSNNVELGGHHKEDDLFKFCLVLDQLDKIG